MKKQFKKNLILILSIFAFSLIALLIGLTLFSFQPIPVVTANFDTSWQVTTSGDATYNFDNFRATLNSISMLNPSSVMINKQFNDQTLTLNKLTTLSVDSTLVAEGSKGFGDACIEVGFKNNYLTRYVFIIDNSICDSSTDDIIVQLPDKTTSFSFDFTSVNTNYDCQTNKSCYLQYIKIYNRGMNKDEGNNLRINKLVVYMNKNFNQKYNYYPPQAQQNQNQSSNQSFPQNQNLSQEATNILNFKWITIFIIIIVLGIIISLIVSLKSKPKKK
jgi:hypothetical protein